MRPGMLVRHLERRAAASLVLFAPVGAALVVLAACRAAAPPAPQPTPPPVVTEERPTTTAPVTVTVTARTLNVRAEPGTDAAIVGRARRGDRLEVVGDRGDWLEVRVGATLAGWVHGRYTRRDTPCPPDREGGEVLEGPPLSFSEIAGHGTVVVEAEVSAAGEVTAARVVRNDTGDPALAELAAHEVRQMRFAPPVRRCVPLPFVYVYERSF